MMPQIRSITSSDVQDLSSFRPSSECFAVPVRLLIGPGEETFDLIVCSVPWIERFLESTPVMDMRHHLVVREFRWDAIRGFIEGAVARCVGDTWADVAQQLSCFALWEYEGYRK